MSRTAKLILVCAVLIAAALWLSELARNCCSARVTPSETEAAIARRVRAWSIPRSAREARNPFSSSPQILAEARHHFADHCASCHANDGSGATEMGQNFYPRVPDMRGPATQRLSDGDLYYIIHNGIRWSAMPAWGNAKDDPDSWKLVLFIRHLPQLTPPEIQDMERFNPKSAVEREEEQTEEKFLEGEPAAAPAPKH